MGKSITIHLPSPLAARIERLRQRGAVVGARPSANAVVVGLLGRALDAIESDDIGDGGPPSIRVAS